MAIEFDIVEQRPEADTELVRVSFRPAPDELTHSNVFHMQLPATGRRIIIDRQGRLIKQSGLLVAPEIGGLAPYPEEDPRDPYRRENFTRNADAEMVKNIEAYWERKLQAAAKGRPYPRNHNTTLNLQVAAGADDARENDGGAFFSSTTAFLAIYADTTTNDRYNTGARFASVAIPALSTIDAATMQFYAQFIGFDNMHSELLMNDVDDAANFSTEADVDSRARTAATTVSWDQDSAGIGWLVSPDFKAHVQEVIDRGGWASGQALCALVDGQSDQDALFAPTSYNGDTSLAPKLDIDFTPPGGGGGTTKRYSMPLTGVG